ncbi:hypothetical protein [Kitasatospora sp. NPDC059571]|uniref:hypothetical protein n=1 Tax=Kitasatospora sp. NPDC059571 TaxID=3346871 RepID=UPI0036AECE3B
MSPTPRESSQANLEAALRRIRQPYDRPPTDLDMPSLAYAQVAATVAAAQALMDVADAIRSLVPAPAPDPGPQAHEADIWESGDGEWNVSCNDCDASALDMGSEHDCEVWAENHAAEAEREEALPLDAEVDGRSYSLDDPDKVHRDMAIDPARTIRTLAKTPAVWQAHVDCPTCEEVCESARNRSGRRSG